MHPGLLSNNGQHTIFSGDQQSGVTRKCSVTNEFVIFGGIYGGVFTAGEAGGLGAFTALIGIVAVVLCVLEWIRETRAGAKSGVVQPDPQIAAE